MTNITENKLAGLTLMIGPILASVIYIIFIAFPAIFSSESIDFTDWSLLAQNTADVELAIRVPLLLIPVFLTFSVFGFSVLTEKIESTSHFLKMGMPFYIAYIIISAAAMGATQAIAWIGGAAWAIAAVTASMSSYAAFLGSIGLLIIALSIAVNKKAYNRKLAYMVAVFMFLSILVYGTILLTRTDFIINITNIWSPIFCIILSVWTFTLGITLYNEDN